MLIESIYSAYPRPRRSVVDQSSLVIAVFLALLFVVAIIGSRAPHPLVDPALAAVQGGL